MKAFGGLIVAKIEKIQTNNLKKFEKIQGNCTSFRK